MAPLIGMACLLSGLWFLIGMPVVVVVYADKCRRTRRLPTGLLVAAVMLIVFYVSAALLWREFARHYWHQSFLTALDASVNAAKYGHEVEHTAEVLVVWLLIVSTFSAVAAGAVTGAVRHLWIKHRRPQ
jgi:amino acid transporter